MVTITFIFLIYTILAYTNGANDNFKGVATLFGSGRATYKKALFWATLTTLAGSFAGFFISRQLIATFSGEGVIPSRVMTDASFLISLGLGAAITVLIATVIGMPISTTHSLVGAFLGAALVIAPAKINIFYLANKFFFPLLLSPVVAMFLTLIVYPTFKFARKILGIEHKMCLCVNEKLEPVYQRGDGVLILKSTGLALTIDELKNCQQHYAGKILLFEAQKIIDKLHYLSAGIVSFARGLNDTPKIVAPLLLVNSFSPKQGFFLVGIAMAMGGLCNARRVATTMSKKITSMNYGQGFSANLITAFLVTLASRWGMPVSTTHVSCGSLFGIGAINKKTNLKIIFEILLAWIFTLPLAGVISAACLFLLRKI